MSLEQSFLPNFSIVFKNKQNVFIYSGGEITMPNMKSWSVHDVLIFERLTGIKVKIVGNGIVNKQNIPANTVLKRSTKIRVSCN